MRIQTLIFTALLFILPTIAVGAATNCPIQDEFTTTDENNNTIYDTDGFKKACNKTPGCVFDVMAELCMSCDVGTYKNSSFTACKDCTNRADAGQYLGNDAYIGMQADICPWKLKCTTGQIANDDNRSCKVCQSHQYQDQEFYIVYNKNGYQDKIPDTVSKYTYHEIGQNDNVGDQLSSAPQCKDKIMEIDWNMPYEGAILSGPLPKYYTCKSKDNKIERYFTNGYYTLVGYSTNKEPKVGANYQCTSTSDPDCYTLDDICQNKTNGTTIYAIWKPAEYQINYYFGDKLLQEVKADFSTTKNIDDITNLISTNGLPWPNNEDMKFHIYDENTLKTDKDGNPITFKKDDQIPQPRKAGNNISIKILCPAGYYCENDNNAQYAVDNYKQCPDGKTSTPGSTKEDECTYNAYSKFCDLNGCMTFE